MPMKEVWEGDVNQHINYCTWIVDSSKFGRDAQCGAPVGYTMRLDEDGSRVRSYDHFCDTHKRANTEAIARIKAGIADGTLNADDYLYDLD